LRSDDSIIIDSCVNIPNDWTILKQYGTGAGWDLAGSDVTFPYAGEWKVCYGATFLHDGSANTLEVGLTLTKNGSKLPASTIFQTFHNKGHVYQLHGSYLVDIQNPVTDFINLIISPSDAITLQSYSDGVCIDAAAAYMDITYAGGGYGIDYTL